MNFFEEALSKKTEQRNPEVWPVDTGLCQILGGQEVKVLTEGSRGEGSRVWGLWGLGKEGSRGLGGELWIAGFKSQLLG